MEDCKKPKTWEEAIENKICIMFFKRGCTNKVLARGLCSCHYHIALRAVKSGRVTWKILEDRCKAAPCTYNNYDSEFED